MPQSQLLSRFGSSMSSNKEWNLSLIRGEFMSFDVAALPSLEGQTAFWRSEWFMSASWKQMSFLSSRYMFQLRHSKPKVAPSQAEVQVAAAYPQHEHRRVADRR